MKSGVTIINNILYYSSIIESGGIPSLYKTEIGPISAGGRYSNGYIWSSIERHIYSDFMESEEIAFVIPAEYCFAKRITVNMGLIRRGEGIQKWIAGLQLPGDLGMYIYGFIPLAMDVIGGSMDVMFYAAVADPIWPLLWSVVDDNVYDKIRIIPEYAGLVSYARGTSNEFPSINNALVNRHVGGTAVVLSHQGVFSGARYYPFGSSENSGLLEDIQTFMMSVFKQGEDLAMILTGSDFKYESELEPKFKILNKKIDAGFAAVSGAAEFLSAGEKCELPAAI